MEQQLQWCSYQLRKLAWQAQLSILFYIISIVVFVLIQSNMEQVKQLDLVVEQLKLQEPEYRSSTQKTNDITRDFYAVLPDQEQSNQKIAQLLALLEQHDLAIDRADFSTIAIPQSKMVLYQIKFPLVGTYTQIRRFVADIMNRQPSIALSHINFKRDELDNDQVSSNIEFLLYTKIAGNH